MPLNQSLWVGEAYAVEVCIGEMYWLLSFNLLCIEVLIVLHIDTICCSVHGCYLALQSLAFITHLANNALILLKRIGMLHSGGA